jgi:hypothetical protein
VLFFKAWNEGDVGDIADLAEGENIPLADDCRTARWGAIDERRLAREVDDEGSTAGAEQNAVSARDACLVEPDGAAVATADEGQLRADDPGRAAPPCRLKGQADEWGVAGVG